MHYSGTPRFMVVTSITWLMVCSLLACLVGFGLQFRARRSGSREELLKMALMKEYKPKDMNTEVLCLLSRELDFGRRDTRYRAPFSVPKDKKMVHSDGEVDDTQLLL